ncbi:MAG: ABC transporter permease [Phycisphaerales bacterium]|nr:ABC transporter permease [Phycisphaerales bacterium]
MRKYRTVFMVALADRLVYRVDFFVSTFLMFIPIVTTVLLWRAIYSGAGGENIGGLNYSDMVSYYLLVMVVRAFGSMPRLASTVASDIRDGELRKYLLQPISYLGYQGTLRLAHKIIYFIMAAAPYALVFWICRRFLPAWPDGGTLCLCVVSLVLAGAIGFFINALIGLLGFWFLEIASFLHLFMTVQYFLSGHMFPLALLPASVRTVISYLPFAYETYYPTLVLLQRTEMASAVEVIGVQAVWVTVLAIVTRVAWSRGLRRYAAFGG